MASYSMEDIELIRRKSGISYEEAVSMLDYHSGDVARVLIDLEKSGRLANGGTGRNAEEKTADEEKGGSKFMNFIQKMYRTRVKVMKEKTVIVNLSVLYVILAVILFSPHLAILSLILGLLLGYKVTVDKDDEDFRSEKVDNIVRTAADNVKQAVNGISREIGNAVDKTRKAAEKKAEYVKKETAGKAEEKAETPTGEVTVESPLSTHMPDLNAGIVRELDRQMNGPDVPTIQVPVRTESTDGHVEVTEDGNGYHTATVG